MVEIMAAWAVEDKLERILILFGKVAVKSSYNFIDLLSGLSMSDSNGRGHLFVCVGKFG
jgi:hypothetical protein